MKAIHRVAFIGNSLPRRCGIATFTSDLQQAVAASPIGIETAIVAMTDSGRSARQTISQPPVNAASAANGIAMRTVFITVACSRSRAVSDVQVRTV